MFRYKGPVSVWIEFLLASLLLVCIVLVPYMKDWYFIFFKNSLILLVILNYLYSTMYAMYKSTTLIIEANVTLLGDTIYASDYLILSTMYFKCYPRLRLELLKDIEDGKIDYIVLNFSKIITELQEELLTR